MNNPLQGPVLQPLDVVVKILKLATNTSQSEKIPNIVKGTDISIK